MPNKNEMLLPLNTRIYYIQRPIDLISVHLYCPSMPLKESLGNRLDVHVVSLINKLLSIFCTHSNLIT